MNCHEPLKALFNAPNFYVTYIKQRLTHMLWEWWDCCQHRAYLKLSTFVARCCITESRYNDRFDQSRPRFCCIAEQRFQFKSSLDQTEVRIWRYIIQLVWSHFCPQTCATQTGIFFQQQKKIKHSKPNFSGTNCVGFCPWHLVLQRSLANRRQSSAEETFKMLFVPQAIIERTLGCHKDTASTVIVYLHDKKSSLCD